MVIVKLYNVNDVFDEQMRVVTRNCEKKTHDGS